MTTSNFARNGRNPRAVAISIGVPPRWYGKRYFKLAPTREMLKMGKEEYDKAYAEILAKLDPVETYKEIVQQFGEDCILLCWESPNIRCHRRIVAEWFESNLGVTISEEGFDRESIKKYSEMLEKGEKPSKKSQKTEENSKNELKNVDLFGNLY